MKYKSWTDHHMCTHSLQTESVSSPWELYLSNLRVPANQESRDEDVRHTNDEREFFLEWNHFIIV